MVPSNQLKDLKP